MLYIAETSYQILISLLKMNIEEDELLIINNPISVGTIKKIETYVNVHQMYSSKFGSHSIINISIRHKIINFLKRFENIIVFLDHREVGAFLNKFKIPYTLCEDGYNFFSVNVVRKNLYTNKLKNMIYNLYFHPPFKPGLSKYCKLIEVNNLDTVIKDERFNKMVELPREYLFKNITPDKYKMILEIFSAYKINPKEKSVLIISQPLWQDKVDNSINTPQQQIEFYTDIIKKYFKQYTVYFKIHPRDKTDYSCIDNVIFIQKEVPLECFELIGEFNFDIGITHSSSSLDYLKCIKEKIFLGKI